MNRPSSIDHPAGQADLDATPPRALAQALDEADDDWGDILAEPVGPRFVLGDLVTGVQPVPSAMPAETVPPAVDPAGGLDDLPGVAWGPLLPAPDRDDLTTPEMLARLLPSAPLSRRAMRRHPDRVTDPLEGGPDVFFDTEHKPFGQYRHVQRLGIIGGKGVGKSYLFQAMVYRAQNARMSGALSYFLDTAGIELVRTLSRDHCARTVNLHRFNGDYECWTRLGTTLATSQPWYRLTLPYRTGFLGHTRAAMEVEFFDGSGEQFFEAKDPLNRGLWELAYREARVMAFCLPLWALFPSADLSAAERRERDGLIESFHEVVQNYKDMRRRLGLCRPVRTLLALTMADDRRCGLPELRDHWIGGYLQRPQAFLAQTRTGRGIARYLANARRVSQALLDEFAAIPSPGLARIPDLLDLGAGRPWLIPVSAIHGDALEHLEREYPNPDERPARLPPVPVHVELPLLVALCVRGNALM